MSREEIIEVVLEAYDARKDTRLYFEYWLNPDPKQALEDACNSIAAIFFRKNGRSHRSFSAADVSKICKEFAVSTPDEECVANLLTFTAVLMAKWLFWRSAILSYRSTAERIYRRALDYSLEHNMLELTGKRLVGVHDFLIRRYGDAISVAPVPDEAPGNDAEEELL